MLRQGVYIKPDDGRLPTPGLKDGQQLTKEQLQIIQKQYQGGIKKEIALLQNEVSQQTTAIGAVRRRWAAELGMSEKEFEQGTSSMAEFEKRTAGYAQYEKYREEHTYTPTRSAAPGAALRSVYDGSQNPYEAYKAWGVFRVDGERYKELVNLIVSRDQKQSSIYNLEGQMYRDINHEGTVETMYNATQTIGNIFASSSNKDYQLRGPNTAKVTANSNSFDDDVMMFDEETIEKEEAQGWQSLITDGDNK